MRFAAVPLAGCLVLLSLGSPASASSGQSGRVATYSSLPCSATTKEYSFWEEDAYTNDAAVTLVCQDKPDHALWILEARVGCRIDPSVPDPNNDTKLNGVCTQGLAEPNMRFLKSSDDDKTHHYQIGRYVYGKDCASATFTKNLTDAPENKDTMPTQDVGWVCKELTAIHGLNAAYDPDPRHFKYTSILVKGPKGDESLFDGPMPLLGVGPEDALYQVEYMNGKVFAR